VKVCIDDRGKGVRGSARSGRAEPWKHRNGRAAPLAGGVRCYPAPFTSGRRAPSQFLLSPAVLCACAAPGTSPSLGPRTRYEGPRDSLAGMGTTHPPPLAIRRALTRILPEAHGVVMFALGMLAAAALQTLHQ
jgi:hypothetical protein